MESQIWQQLARSVGGGFKKNDSGLCLPWCQTLQFLLVYHWCLSSCYPSTGTQRERVWVHECMCGFFKRNWLGLQKVLPLTQSLLVFLARSCGDLSSWHWKPGPWCLVWDWDSLLPGFPSQIFIHCMWVRDQPIPHLHLSYQSGWM